MMPSSDYMLTAPCSEIAGQVMAPAVYPQKWVAAVGHPEFALAIFGVALNVVLLCLVARGLVRSAKLLMAWRERPVWKAVLCVAAAGISFYGMTKSTSRVNFPRTDMEAAYLIDCGSYVSNNLVHVDFNTFLIPQDASITLAYWPIESTNEDEIVEYITQPLSAWPRPLDLEFENAISNRWYCYTTWTPGPAVHTNGVWQQTGMTDWRNHRDTILIRTLIIEDGEAIAPPKFGKGKEGDDTDE